MIKLLEFIYEKLIQLSDAEVYQEKVPEDVTPIFPYIIFSMSVPDRNIEQNLCFLEIDFWNNTNDLLALEELVTKVEGNSSRDNPTGLDEFRYLDNGLQAVFYRILRTALPDPDIKIRRRQLRFLVKVRFI